MITQAHQKNGHRIVYRIQLVTCGKRVKKKEEEEVEQPEYNRN